VTPGRPPIPRHGQLPWPSSLRGRRASPHGILPTPPSLAASNPDKCREESLRLCSRGLRWMRRPDSP
jgi:hypothetical protein